MSCKEYGEVLDLARGVISETLEQTADGFQVKDLAPIFSENLDKAMLAYTGGSLIAAEWRDHSKDCILLTMNFAIDTACDALRIPATSGLAFQETLELMDMVQGLTMSVLKKLPGGVSPAEGIEIVFENIPGVIKGVDGMGKISEEFKSNIRDYLKCVCTWAVNFAFSLKDASVKIA
jgi:hypothetical protein